LRRTSVGLIGRVDRDGLLMDGQTVKTRTLYRLMVGRYGPDGVICADTRDYRRRPIRVALSLLLCVLRCKRIVVALSTHGRAMLFPVLYVCSRFFGTEVHHNLIGGWLASDVRSRPALVRYLNSFKVNYVESHELCAELSQQGVESVRYLPNFKMVSPVACSELAWDPHEPVRLCLFSRIQERKGVTDAILAVAILNNRASTRFSLDLFGPIDPEYGEALSTLLNEHASYVTYKGVVEPDMSVQAIARYDGLVFPTRYREEGIPGTIIDGLSAGLPIVSARWRYYDEVLEDGATGISYPLGDVEALAGAIGSLFAGDHDLLSIKRECLNRAALYSPASAFSQIAALLEDESLA